jgi:hypothetical protein
VKRKSPAQDEVYDKKKKAVAFLKKTPQKTFDSPGPSAAKP